MAAATATAGTAACSSSSSSRGGTDAAANGGVQPPPATGQPEPLRKPRVDPRRRQAALSFLTNISLDGRPPLQDDEWGGGEEGGAAKPGARTRLSLLAAGCSAFSAPGSAAAPWTAGPCPLPPSLVPRASGEPPQPPRSAPAVTGAQLQLPDGLGSAGQEELEEDPFTSVQTPPVSFLGSGTPGSASGSRGRLNSFTQGILPIAFSRQNSQNYCALEPAGQGGSTSALEQLQRSR